MMPMEMTVEQFEREMDALVERLASDPFELALDKIMHSIVPEGISQIFAQKIDSQGSGWAPHAPATVRRYGPHELLVLTGDLRASVVGGGQGHYEIAGNREMVYGTEIHYAIFIQEGTSRMPDREFLYWSDAMLDGAEEELWEYIDTNMIG